MRIKLTAKNFEIFCGLRGLTRKKFHKNEVKKIY